MPHGDLPAAQRPQASVGQLHQQAGVVVHGPGQRRIRRAGRRIDSDAPAQQQAVSAVILQKAPVRQISTGIKWVNDLFYQGKKVCGILAEGAGDAVVLGVGVDVYRPAQPLPPKLQDVMGFLLEEPVYGVMEMLAAAIANNLLTRDCRKTAYR